MTRPGLHGRLITLTRKWERMADHCENQEAATGKDVVKSYAVFRECAEDLRSEIAGLSADQTLEQRLAGSLRLLKGGR